MVKSMPLPADAPPDSPPGSAAQAIVLPSITTATVIPRMTSTIPQRGPHFGGASASWADSHCSAR